MCRRLLVVAFALAGCVPGLRSVDEAGMICPKGPTVKGVDVSHYDGAIDWGMVKGAGIDFAIIKATEGLTVTDPEFAPNFQFAGQNGIVRGGYHFLHPMDDAVMQADYFLSVLGPSLPGDLPPSLDLEVTDGLSNAAVAASALAFAQRIVEKTGRTPIIYTSLNFMSSIGDPMGDWTAYDLWVASRGVSCPNMPAEWTAWAIWQTTFGGTVAGIPSSPMVDLNEFNGSLAQLQGFAGTPGSDGGSSGSVDDGGAHDDGGGGVSPGERDLSVPQNPGHIITGSAHGCAFGGGGSDGNQGPVAIMLVALALVVMRRRYSSPSKYSG